MNEDTPHRYELEVSFDSETASATKLYFCAGCGRPRAPKMRKLTRDTPCVQVSPEEVQTRISSRMVLLAAMVGGGHEPTNKRNRKRRPGDSNPAP